MKMKKWFFRHCKEDVKKLKWARSISLHLCVDDLLAKRLQNYLCLSVRNSCTKLL